MMYRGDYWDHLSGFWEGASFGWLTWVFAMVVILGAAAALVTGIALCISRGGWGWPVLGALAFILILVLGFPFVNWYGEWTGFLVSRDGNLYVAG